ncbi:glycosyltransferase family 4 protein [Candidatus Woesearchaeota archaeon]|nr:glycosyltransferase family 4 protein [Candidatus Woesearchaeota archaeon]
MHYKGLDILVKAFAKLEKERNDVFLLICGDGPFKVEIKKLIQELNIKNIHFEDKIISPYEKGFYYSICDVFVLPSTFRDYDADCWGVVLNEAMSLGKPVISTDATGGAHDLIKQGINGFMVKEKDIEGLYNSLRKILSDKRLKEKMGKESKKIIENNFTYELMARGCIDAIMYTLYLRKT